MKRDFAVAVKAVIIKENRALVLCRSKDEMEGSYMNSHQKWDLPGGGLHFFEKFINTFCFWYKCNRSYIFFEFNQR